VVELASGRLEALDVGPLDAREPVQLVLLELLRDQHVGDRADQRQGQAERHEQARGEAKRLM
jgi:hypothetical protein